MQPRLNSITSVAMLLLSYLAPLLGAAQHPYYDSQSLREASEQGNLQPSSFFRILAAYYPPDQQPVSTATIYHDFSTNPFLRVLVEKQFAALLDSLDQKQAFLSKKSVYEAFKVDMNAITEAARKASAVKNAIIKVKNADNKLKLALDSLRKIDDATARNTETDNVINRLGELAKAEKSYKEILEKTRKRNQLAAQLFGQISKAVREGGESDFKDKWYPLRYSRGEPNELAVLQAAAADRLKFLAEEEKKRSLPVGSLYKAGIDTFLLSGSKLFTDISLGPKVMTQYQKTTLQADYKNLMDQISTLDNELDQAFKNLPSFTVSSRVGVRYLSVTSPYVGLGLTSGNELSMRAAQAIASQQRAAVGVVSWQTAALDGLSMFVAERLGEELNAVFFQRFTAILNDPRYADLPVLFPNTTKLLTKGSVDYSAVLQLLRTAFRQDLSEILFHFGDLLYPAPPQEGEPRRSLPSLFEVLNRNPEKNAARLQQLRYMYIVLSVFQEATRGTHPAILIDHLLTRVEATTALYPAQSGLRQGVRRLQCLSRALTQETDPKRTWLPEAALKALLTDKTRLPLFLGLLYKQLDVPGLPDPLLYDIGRFQSAVQGFGALAVQLEDQLHNLKKRSGAEGNERDKNLRPADYEPLYRTLLAVAELGATTLLNRPASEFQQLQKLSDAALEGYTAAAEGRYGVAVANLLQIATALVPPDADLRLRERKQVLKSLGVTPEEIRPWSRDKLLVAYSEARQQLINLGDGEGKSPEAVLTDVKKTVLTAVEEAELDVQQRFLAEAHQVVTVAGQYAYWAALLAKYPGVPPPRVGATPEERQKGLASYAVAVSKAVAEKIASDVKAEVKVELDKQLTVQQVSGYLGKLMEVYGVARGAKPLSTPQLIRYGQFMAAVAEATSAEDVRNALRAAALPTGSSSVKRQSFANLSVNSFAGLNLGGEWLDGAGGMFNHQRLRMATGFTVPIGLCMSWGLSGSVAKAERRVGISKVRLSHDSYLLRRRRYNHRVSRLNLISRSYQYYNGANQQRYMRGSSLSIFASLIDIGALVQFRLNKETATSALPTDVTFRQVFAPGLYGVYGFRNSPLSVLMGGQFNPQLRKVGQDSKPQDTFRLSVGLVMDIPLFNLFTRSERRGTVDYDNENTRFEGNSGNQNLIEQAKEPQQMK